jgi:uncharacterized protein (TIGR03435 family)
MSRDTKRRKLSLILAAAVLFGAPGQPTFETISIKAGKAGVGGLHPTVGYKPPLLTVKNTSLQSLIQIAYHVRAFQVLAVDGWISSESYDIDAKVAGKPTPEQWGQIMWPLLQALIQDRFKVKLHREIRQLPVYVLTVARGGLRMQKSKDTSCPTFKWERNTPPAGELLSLHCGVLELTNIQLNRTLEAAGMSLTETSVNSPGLIAFLSRELDSIVIDKTGLTGLFDFHLEWNRQATADPSSADEFYNPSLLTAVREQLGLKLELTKGPVEVLVIDHAEKPGEN